MNAPTLNPAQTSPCPVDGCKDQATAFVCDACWARLPEGVQRAVSYTLKTIKCGDLPRQRREECGEILAQALARLGAELAGAPLGEQLAEADELTRRCHSFDSFAELINATGNYWPKLYVGKRDQPDAVIRQSCQRLADLYDAAQAARGDSRRATRLGIAGL